MQILLSFKYKNTHILIQDKSFILHILVFQIEQTNKLVFTSEIIFIIRIMTIIKKKTFVTVSFHHHHQQHVYCT